MGQVVRLLAVGALVAAHWITFFLAARLSSVSVCLAGLATLALWTSLLEPLLLWRRVRGYEVGLGLITMVSGGIFNSLAGVDSMMTLVDTDQERYFSYVGGAQVSSRAYDKDESHMAAVERCARQSRVIRIALADLDARQRMVGDVAARQASKMCVLLDAKDRAGGANALA